MKKALSLILALSVIISLFVMPQPVYSADYEGFIKELTVLTDIGIVDGNFKNKKEDDKVTRGEFSQLVCNLINFSYIGSEYEEIFTDVKKGSNFFSGIMALYSLGAVSGYSETEFKPQNEITLTEAMKIVIKLMGYTYLANSQGGYPTGYQYVANNLGLTKGISGGYSLSATFTDIVRLLYNSLDVSIAKASGISGDGEKIYEIMPYENILTEYHRMQKVKGIVTANPLAGIKNYSPVGEGYISVNGVSYKIKENSNIDLIGNKVEVIYSFDNENENTIISIVEANDANSVFTLDISDITDGRNNSVIYEDENGNLKTLTFSNGADIIYNGERISIQDSFFTTLSSGTAQFIKTSGSDYDVVKVSDFKTMVVDKIDKQSKILTDIYKTELISAATLDLSDNKHVIIRDYKGNNVPFDYISKGDIITYADNANNAVVYVGGEVISGRISSIQREAQKTYIALTDTSYKLNKEASLRYTTFDVGDYVALYLDKFGNIAYIAKKSSDGYEILYLTKAVERQSGPGTKIIGRFFGKGKGLNDYEFTEDVVINGVKKNNLDFQTFSSCLGGNMQQLVQVKLSEDGKVNEINTAKTLEYLEDNFTDGFCKTHELMSRSYWKDPPNFSRSILVSKNTTEMIVVPKDPENADEDDYYTITTASLAETDYYMEAYALTKDYQIPDYIIIKMNTGGGSSSAPAFVYETPVYTLKSIREIVDEDGMPITRYTVQHGTTESYFYIDKNDMPVSKVTYNGDNTETDFTPDMLSVGDVFRFSKDSKGYIRRFEIFYDYSRPDSWFYNEEVKKYGYIKTTVERKSGSYFFVPHWWLQPEGEKYGGFGLEEPGVAKVITVLDATASGKPIVRAGTASDIEKGDEVIIHVAYAQLIGVTVLKK